MKNIAVTTLPIRLGQFLKLANLVQDGFEAKVQITEGEVVVNGETETRRGRQLREDDIVSYQNVSYLVCAATSSPADI